MTVKYKIVVKNGDSKYQMTRKGNYEYKNVDFVQEFDDLGNALSEFLSWTTDEAEDKVSLIYVPNKKG